MIRSGVWRQSGQVSFQGLSVIVRTWIEIAAKKQVYPRRARLACGCLVLLAGCAPQGKPTDEVVAVLEPGEIRQLSFASGIERLGVSVDATDLLAVRVEQHNLDVAVALEDPAGRVLATVDSPNSSHGAERLWWQVEESGLHSLSIRPLAQPMGEAHGFVQVEVLAASEMSDRDRLLVAASTARAWAVGKPAEVAAEALERSVDAFRQAGEVESTLLSLVELVQQRIRLQQTEAALRSLEEGLELAKISELPRLEILILQMMGHARRRDGAPDEVRSYYLRALALAMERNILSSQASAWNNLGLIDVRTQQFRSAVESYRRALELFRRLERGQNAATVLLNLGRLYGYLGKFDLAIRSLGEAEALFEGTDQQARLDDCRLELAWVTHLAGGHSEALEILERLLESFRLAGDTDRVAIVQDRLGSVLQALGRLAEARSSFEASAATPRRGEGTWSKAQTDLNLAEVALASGRYEDAEQLLERAFEGLDAAAREDSYSRAHAHRLRSEALRQGDQGQAALDHSERALKIIEALRLETSAPSLTVPFFSGRSEFFDHQVSLLLELHLESPTAGHAAQAFQTLDLGQARSLIESVRRRTRLAPTQPTETAQDLLGGQVVSAPGGTGLRAYLDELTDRQWAQAQPEPPILELDELTRMLEDSTLLLVYFDDGDAGRLFAVDGRGLEVFETAPIEQIDSEIGRLWAAVTRAPGPSEDLRLASARLSAWLLGPVARHLAPAERVVFVGEGALHNLPLALLHHPTTRRPLTERYELVRIPSASLLAELRRRARGRSPGRGLAVFANPAFGSSADGSFDTGAENLRGTWAAEIEAEAYPELESLPSLPGTAKEAEVLARLWPEEPILTFLGEQASETQARSRALRGFRILHFATHALLHPHHPELGRLALTPEAPDDSRRDGQLRAYELAGLDLTADLVVLSACRSALGLERTGEGVVGLPRAFLHAGASSVLVSLWDVEDRAGAAFMEIFYRHLAQENNSIAAALRRAQLEMQQSSEWSSPYYWAGFELQGDWCLSSPAATSKES